MDSGQALRQLGRSLRASLVNAFAWLGKMLRAGLARIMHWVEEREGPVTMVTGMGWIGRLVVFVFIALLIIYPVGAWWASTMDDDPDFGAAALKPNQSLAIANMAALLDREVNTNGWTPNDTILWPSVLLDNMPNYQRGILTALQHVSAQLAGQDDDLKEATELLGYPPDVWVWQPLASLWPASSEHKYNNAVEALRRYNDRLAAGPATGRAPAVLAAVLSRAASDLGKAATAIDNRISNRSGFLFINNEADDIFYTTKGELYAYYIVLKGMERDYPALIKQRGLEKNWRAMMESLRAGASLRPWIVLNAEPDSSFATCILCSEGFYVLRAEAEMRGLAEKLK
jgi:hypothetical protein